MTRTDAWPQDGEYDWPEPRCPKSDLLVSACAHCRDLFLPAAERLARDAELPSPNASIGLPSRPVEAPSQRDEVCHVDEAFRRGKFGRGKRQPGHG